MELKYFFFIFVHKNIIMWMLKNRDSMRVSIETEIPGKAGIPETRLSNFFLTRTVLYNWISNTCVRAVQNKSRK